MKHIAAIVTIRNGVVHNLDLVMGKDEDENCLAAEKAFKVAADGEGKSATDEDLDNGYVETLQGVGSSVCLCWLNDFTGDNQREINRA